jgi:ATP-dependent RNA helicase RhlE
LNLDQRLNDTNFDSYSRRSDKMTKPTDNGFDNLGIAPILLKGINRLHFKNPTPIQIKAIPVAIDGDDIIGIAQTGSGKTIAYGIPMLQRLSKSKRGSGLVVVPTRELAIQVEESLRAFSRSVNIRSVVLIGGASMSMQCNALRKNPRLVIATPGRLMDHIQRKTVSLANVEVFILDEADRMLDMGFIPDIKKIMKSIPDQRQTMLFSATMPKEIEDIARKLMEAPTRIEIDRSGIPPAEISHEMFFIKNQDKKRLLAFQLRQFSGPVLVFTRTKRMASKLAAKVNNMGFAAAEIHSDRSQGQRRNALEGFKRGRYQILIATDIAARGIDVTGIELVVNYDMPANSEDYVHRIGRTGRAGKAGHAISFANTAQKGSIRNIERFMKTKLVISSLPILPSETGLLEEADLSNFRREPSRDEKPSRRKYSRDRSSKRPDFKKSGPKKYAKKRSESKPDDFEVKESSPRKPRRNEFWSKDSKRKRSKQDDFRSKDSNKQKSERKVSKPKKSKSADFKKKDSGNESSYFANFKKNRPSKKRPAGQGSKRKKRAKNK